MQCSEMSKGFAYEPRFSNNLHKSEADLSSPTPLSDLSLWPWWQHPTPNYPTPMWVLTLAHLPPLWERDTVVPNSLQLSCKSSSPSIPHHLCWYNKRLMPRDRLNMSPFGRVLDFRGLLLICLFSTPAANHSQLFVLLDAMAERWLSPLNTLLTEVYPCEVQTGFHGCSVLHLSHLKFSSCFISHFDSAFLEFLTIIHISPLLSSDSFFNKRKPK